MNNNQKPKKLAATECVYFDAEKSQDTHKVYDPSTDTLTVPVSGEYIVIRDGKRLEGYLLAGDVLQSPQGLIKESCGVFYETVKDKK